jgi:glycosyltransferase involved in cell wall biosynthesis
VASKPKVCHFSSVHRVDDVRVHHKECRTLAEAGFDVTLVAVAADGGATPVKLVPLADEPSRLRRMTHQTRAAVAAAKATGAAIYHFHDPELLPFALGLKRATGARVIYDSHECYAEDIAAKEYINPLLRSTVARAVQTIEDFVVKRLDLVVAATPHIGRYFAPRAERVITVNNFPLKGEFGPSESRDVQASRAVCYVGAISFVRGILPLLDAFDNVRDDVALLLAGRFASADVEQAVRQHRNWHRVRFYGQVSRREVAEIYDQSFAGIVNFLPAPNHIHSQPNKLFEYMAAGIPVIASDFALWRDLIETNAVGLCVDPSSGPAIAAAINALAAEPMQAQAMSARGSRLTQDVFTWENEGRKLVEAYEQLLKTNA